MEFLRSDVCTTNAPNKIENDNESTIQLSEIEKLKNEIETMKSILK